MYPGGKKGNMNDLMKQAKKMQEQMMKAQEELANKVVEATSGGGMVTVTMNGQNELLSVKIDKEVVDPADVEMLEDLILAAVNEAHLKVAKSSEEEMSKFVPGNMKIPGLF
ncbi:MAG: YbaB/EbfC family nucleoid-associated protein [Candidatus Stygibacter frigidus]|nr:YbaB/EbfC family nucleoid-associated protein [Candidatus Stygibacter frigidus]